jgi:alcohol dehydrogenase
VARLTAIDAVSHAVESAVCTRRNAVSSMHSREAFVRLAAGVEAVLDGSATPDDRASVLLGAAFAGMAIENSMLGAAHATANPLTARHGLAHGHAVALTLPAVVRWNLGEPAAAAVYRDLGSHLGEPLADWLERIIAAAGLSEAPGLDLDEPEIGRLAELAAAQWTGRFNPRPMERRDLAAIYRSLPGIHVAS